jgi:hypothetical protein
MEVINIVLNAFVTIFSIGLFVVSILSYKKYKNFKLLFVSSAFFVFFIKGLLQSINLFYEEIAIVSSNIYAILFDLIIIILLFVATLKR